jgi:hypothetical protein
MERNAAQTILWGGDVELLELLSLCPDFAVELLDEANVAFAAFAASCCTAFSTIDATL